MSGKKLVDSSLKSILRVTLPVLLSTLSVNLMHVIDRIMLAGYSVDAMNGSVIGGHFCGIFIYLFISVISTSEIFVGQYNGSEQYDKLAIPVWQMFYLTLASFFVYIPIAYFSEYLNLLPDYCLSEGLIYQKILIYFAFMPLIKVALSAFFIGQGKTKIVTYCVCLAVVSNTVLDYLFIYGVEGFIPRMGTKGAAIATIIVEFMQICILAAIFFKKKNREKYKTLANCAFNKDIFLSCVKVGVPLALSDSIIMVMWSLIQAIVTHISEELGTIYCITSNVYVMFIFFGDGMIKAAATICSNMIGEGDKKSLKKTCHTLIGFSFTACAIMSIPLVFFPNLFLSLLDMLPENLTAVYDQLTITLKLLALTITVETMMYTFWGILTSGGDTKYPVIVHQSTLWILLFVPIIILRYFNALNSVPLVYILIIFAQTIGTIFIYKRYKSMKWYHKLV